MGHWLKNCWYQAGWSDEVQGDQLLERTILSTPLVLHRSTSGEIIALLDRCPHRFAPLSAGTKEGDELVCGYHGLGFGPDGKCVRNPHGHISAGMKVDAYPTAERHGAIWIWMGQPELADEKQLPDLSFVDRAPATGKIAGYMPTKADYQLITDNILDLSHADYLHPHTLGGMMTESDFSCEDDGEDVLLSWKAQNVPPPGVFLAELPPPQKGDFQIDVRWSAPAVMVLKVAGKAHGIPFEDEDFSFTLHNMVPETETSTHYFYCSVRQTRTDDAEFMTMLKQGLEHSFMNEDKPMLEKQQARIGNDDFWSLKPRLLSIDEGSVRVRRKLDALITAETAPAES